MNTEKGCKMARGIYKRGNTYWLRYASLDGRIIRESSGSTKFRDAEDLLLKRKQELREGKEPETKVIKNYLFKELAGEYLKWSERQRSFRSKKGFILQLVNAFGQLPLRMFNTKLLEQYQTERISKGNKPATVNRLIATIKHMFTKASEWDMVSGVVLKRIRRVKLLEENNRRLRYLSIDEIKKLISSCESHLKPIVITALNTGMRKGEILSLQWKNVDLKNGFILLEKTKSGDRREIPMNDTLRQTLQKLNRRLDVSYVFFDPHTCKPYKDVKRSFGTACKRAGITDFKFHDMSYPNLKKIQTFGFYETYLCFSFGYAGRESTDYPGTLGT